MKGVIVTFPGVPKSTLQALTGPEVFISYDTFDIGKIPSTSAEKRVYQFSKKTIVVIDNPVNIITRIAFDHNVPVETLLHSHTMGVPRLIQFMEIWHAVAHQKELPVLTMHALKSGYGVQFLSRYLNTACYPTTFPSPLQLPQKALCDAIKRMTDGLFQRLLSCGNKHLEMKNEFESC